MLELLLLLFTLFLSAAMSVGMSACLLSVCLCTPCHICPVCWEASRYSHVCCVVICWCCLTAAFHCLIPLQKDNEGKLFEDNRMTQNDMDVLQNGPLHDDTLMHGLYPSFWFRVRVIYTGENTGVVLYPLLNAVC